MFDPAILRPAITILAVFTVTMLTAAYMTWVERRFSAALQERYGPNRVGPFGLLQPFADMIKLFLKEEVTPDGANPLLFRIAPAFTAVPAMIVVGVIPFGFLWGEPLAIANIDVGVLFILAVGSLGVFGPILGGWASHNKYSLLGAMRATAQMVSYELALILAVIAVLAVSNSLNLTEIVIGQDARWNVFNQPLAALLFLIAIFAETNRHPFDFAECEPELVGGFHTEYSSMRFGLFFMGEYIAMFTMCCLMTVLFFGGSDLPFMEVATMPAWLSVLAFLGKTALFLVFFVWVRWTIPRFRYDQLMWLGWRVLLPLALVNLAATGAWLALGGAQ